MRWYSLVTLRACLREVTREEDGTMAMDFRIKTLRRRGKWNQCVRLGGCCVEVEFLSLRR